MCYISDLEPGDRFLVKDKRGIWVISNRVYKWILEEAGMSSFNRDSDLDSLVNRGYLCFEEDTGEPFVFTAGAKVRLEVSQL